MKLTNTFYSFKEVIIHVNKFLIILLPLFFISGPFLTDFVFSLCALSLFFFLQDKEIKKLINSKFFIYFICFYLVLLFSSIMAIDKVLSLSNSIFYFRFGLFTIFFYFIILNHPKILKKFFFVFLVCYSILFVDGIYQYFIGYNLFFFDLIEKDRVSSFFGDELIMGSYLSRFFPLVIGLYAFLFVKSKKHFLHYLLFLNFVLLTIILVLMSGERTAFFFIIFGCILIVIFFNNFKVEKIILISVKVLILIILFLNTSLNDRIINLTLEDTNLNELNFENLNKGKIVFFNKQYQEHYRSGLNIFIDNPIIGVGPKNFRKVCSEKKYNISKDTCSTHPHNTYIQLLSETGLIGFSIIFTTLIYIIFLILKSQYRKLKYKKPLLNNLQISILISLTISLFPFSPSGNFFNNWVSCVYYLPIAILIWSLKKNRRLK